MKQLDLDFGETKMIDIMLDLETMGNGPNAAIIAIGAVAFSPETQALGAEFYLHVDLESSVQAGGVMDPSTVLWWLKQSGEARAAFEGKGESLVSSLMTFSAWVRTLGEVGEIKMWGNGAAFDNVILSTAYRYTGLLQPWPFWNDRCYRTVKALHPGVKAEKVGVAHNALDDAKSQALHLMKILAPK